MWLCYFSFWSSSLPFWQFLSEQRSENSACQNEGTHEKWIGCCQVPRNSSLCRESDSPRYVSQELTSSKIVLFEWMFIFFIYINIFSIKVCHLIHNTNLQRNRWEDSVGWWHFTSKEERRRLLTSWKMSRSVFSYSLSVSIKYPRMLIYLCKQNKKICL